MQNRKRNFLRLLFLLVLVTLVIPSVGCDEGDTYVGVSYGYPGWGGPCCWGGPGWVGGPTYVGGGVYMGGPVWR
jgi:hypothetical protein